MKTILFIPILMFMVSGMAQDCKFVRNESCPDFSEYRILDSLINEIMLGNNEKSILFYRTGGGNKGYFYKQDSLNNGTTLLFNNDSIISKSEDNLDTLFKSKIDNEGCYIGKCSSNLSSTSSEIILVQIGDSFFYLLSLDGEMIKTLNDNTISFFDLRGFLKASNRTKSR